MSKYIKKRKLSAEQLEKRDLMAGNVTANIVGDTLFIRGDKFANDVSLIHESGGKLKLVGNSTKINGRVEELPLQTGFRGKVDIHLGGGDDNLLFGHGRSYDDKSFQSLRVDMGSGDNETVILASAKFEGDILINTGGGKAHVSLGDTQAKGDVKVTTGDKDDLIRMANTRYAKTTEFITNDGNDKIVTGPASYDYAQFNRLNIRTGKGNDYVVLDQLRADTLFADLGDGNDEIVLVDNSRTNTTHLEGGTGIDYFTISRESSIKGLRTSSITRR